MAGPHRAAPRRAICPAERSPARQHRALPTRPPAAVPRPAAPGPPGRSPPWRPLSRQDRSPHPAPPPWGQRLRADCPAPVAVLPREPHGRALPPRGVPSPARGSPRRRGPIRGYPPMPGQPGPVYPPGQFSDWNRPSVRASWLGANGHGDGAGEADAEPGYSVLATSDPSADATATQTWAVIDDTGGWSPPPLARDVSAHTDGEGFPRNPAGGRARGGRPARGIRRGRDRGGARQPPAGPLGIRQPACQQSTRQQFTRQRPAEW